MSPRLRLVAFSALVGGLLLRVLELISSPTNPLHECDGRAYYVMGRSWAQGRGLYIDDPLLVGVCTGIEQLGPSRHFAPALPLIEGSFYLLLGEGTLALVLPLLLLSVLTVAVVWWTTRDLYGRDAALLAGAAVSLEWTGMFYGTWAGYSENLVIIALTLTLWALFRGLRDERYMLAAGLFAGLGYLSKASIGWFFVIAGIGGVAWRVLFRGWRVLGNRWYWGAVGIFAVMALAWAGRNISLFWDGTPVGLLEASQTSAVVGRMVAQAFEQPGQLLVGLAGKLPILLLGLMLPFLPLLRLLETPLRRWKDEEAAGLWLTVGLVFALGWFFAAIFWIAEDTNLFWADAIRYVMPAQVPLLWLVLRQGGPHSTQRWSLSLLILAVMVFVFPYLLTAGPLAKHAALLPQP